MSESSASDTATASDTGVVISRRRRFDSLLSVQGWLTAVLCVMGAVVIGGSVAVATLLHRTDAATHQLADSISPARSAAFELQGALRDQETGVRGYVITGDRRFFSRTTRVSTPSGPPTV